MTNRRTNRPGGFTLLELLVAVAVLMIVMVVLLQLTGEVGKIWKTSAGKISGFQNARAAFSTITRTLSRATLNTYNDYFDDSKQEFRTAANAGTFKPTRFRRASELHFLAGPAAAIVPGATAAKNPGSAIFFQVPSGKTDDPDLESLNRTVNAVGFFIEYAAPDADLMPTWMHSIFSTQHRFRLVQVVEPTEEMSVYDSTATAQYNLDWLNKFSVPHAPGNPRFQVLAENVCLLVFRPRLAPEEEKTASTFLGTAYDPAKPGGALSPNFHYDSRAWESGYAGGVTAAAPAAKRGQLMQNQVPPIVDVAMVSLDTRSLARLDFDGESPPSVLAVPSGLFTDATKFFDDLATYSDQLNENGIRHRVFQTAVQLQGSKWSSHP